MDPLYHQTTAQFDEGGAKGLLLNNLGVYGDCRVLFDSQEVPAKCMSSSTDNKPSALIDISFAGGLYQNINTVYHYVYTFQWPIVLIFFCLFCLEYVEQMVMNMQTKKDICPTFNAIIEQLDEFSLRQRMSDQSSLCDNDATYDSTVDLSAGPEFTSMDNAANDNGVEFDDGAFDNGEADHHDKADVAIDNFDASSQHMTNHYEVPLNGQLLA